MTADPVSASKNSDRARPFELAIAAALISALLMSASRQRHRGTFRSDAGDVQINASGTIRMSTAGASFEIAGGRRAPAPNGADEDESEVRDEEQAGSLRAVQGEHGTLLEGLVLEAMVDGALARVIADPPRTTPDGPAHARAHAMIETDTEGSLEAEISYTLLRSPPALSIGLRSLSAESHTIALRIAAPVGDRAAFVPGTGVLADLADVSGAALLLEDPAAAGSCVGIASPEGDLAIHFGGGETAAADRKTMTFSATSPPVESLGATRAIVQAGTLLANGFTGSKLPDQTARLLVVVGASEPRAAQGVAELRHEQSRSVSGRVNGGGPGVEVWGIGGDGRPVVHARPDEHGRFLATAPAAALGWYATNAETRASSIVNETAGSAGPIELTMLPGGELHIRVHDADTHEPLTSRLVVHGIPPTADPNFGPDYRASGAGPLVDALRGDATMPLPTGRYRILATHGMEYTIDERLVDVAPGSSQKLDLTLRHVVDTPGYVGCDLHVHARPSFDTPVLVEDRVLSLVAAGIDFAVASEHNVVGDYAPALAALELGNQLASVRGVEITTYRPSFGHFNVFPYDDSKVPPYRHTTLKRIFKSAREGPGGSERILQVNHPRLAKGIGYFDLVGLDTTTMHAARDFRDDFDTLEVYNGFGASDRASVEVVMRDWLRLLEAGHRYTATGDSDSHRIQYQWAGFPRTYVRVAPNQGGAEGSAVDPKAVITSLKEGRAFVSSGPIIDATLDGVEPGGTLPPLSHVGRLHIRVRAAPWIDVGEVEVLLGTSTVSRFSIPTRPLVLGPPTGDLAAAERDAIRYEGEIDVAAPETGGFVVVVVRGNRRMDDVLPYMPIQPLAFTNPIWIAPRALAAPTASP